MMEVAHDSGKEPMPAPDLIPNLLKHYRNIRRQDGLPSAVRELRGEQALIDAALAQGRISPESAETMLKAYRQVEEELFKDVLPDKVM